MGMETYSMDLRKRVIRAYDDGVGTQDEVAELFGVSVAWLKKLLRQRRQDGSIAPRPHGGGWTPKFNGEKLERLKGLVQQDPGATLAELLERSQVPASIMAVQRALKRLGCRRKKSLCTRQSRTGPT